MSENGKHTIRDKVTFPTIATILAFLIINLFTNVWPFVRDFSLSFLRWCLTLLIAFWSHLLSAAGVPWVILYLSWALLAILLWAIVTSVMIARGPNGGARSYTEDTFFGILWRWKLNSKFYPYDISPFCPHCDMQLSYKWFGAGNVALSCERCKEIFSAKAEDPESLKDRLVREIQRKIRTADWKKTIAKEREQT